MMRRRAGFTLVELLVVVVVLGILAAMAIPKFKNTKGKANAAALRTDLRNLATAEESFFYSNNHYTAALDSLKFRGSPGVVILIPEASPAGWSATVTHPQAWPLRCSLFMANAAPLAPATAEGLITCQ
ncbi:MAG TPA: prepilin-type N-terminal cleavage/methylation domain-containing protein [Gemmatimonadaceae bacterium]|nr:prepilin-type N-terminal cleavage/methylation domain-containing protein [Gemmatimonadaceae bacterium]